MHLYHVQTKINIPSLNNEHQRPRQQHHVTVITLLIKRDAVTLMQHHGADAMYNRLILLRKNWQMFFHLLSVHFCNYAVLCHTKIFDSDWFESTKNFIHEVVRVMVVIAAD